MADVGGPLMLSASTKRGRLKRGKGGVGICQKSDANAIVLIDPMTLGQTVNSRDFPNATTWEAVLKASLAKHPTCCPFGRSFANHLLNSGYEIQETRNCFLWDNFGRSRLRVLY
jgi:hypothetical protein